MIKKITLLKRIFIVSFLLIYYPFFVNAIDIKIIYQKHFVFVHGSWHGSWCWYQLVDYLEQDGFRVTLIDLPGHGIDSKDPSTVTLVDYQKKLVNFLDTLTTPVILVGHSMGGIAISTAAEARPKMIEKLVYIAAFMVQNGQSMFDLAAQDSNSLVLQNLIVKPEENLLEINRNLISDMFYGMSPRDNINLSRYLLRVEPLAPLGTPLKLSSNYQSVRRFYITTLNDKAVTPQLQQIMYTASPCERVYSLYTDHSPFFSDPKDLENILIEIAGL